MLSPNKFLVYNAGNLTIPLLKHYGNLPKHIIQRYFNCFDLTPIDDIPYVEQTNDIPYPDFLIEMFDWAMGYREFYFYKIRNFYSEGLYFDSLKLAKDFWNFPDLQDKSTWNKNTVQLVSYYSNETSSTAQFPFKLKLHHFNQKGISTCNKDSNFFSNYDHQLSTFVEADDYGSTNYNLAANLPWSIDFLNKYCILFYWKELSTNPTLPWSNNLLEAFDISSYAATNNPNIHLLNIGWDLESLSINKGIYDKMIAPLKEQELIDLLDQIKDIYADADGQRVLPF